jgi:serine/threonine protein kinase
VYRAPELMDYEGTYTNKVDIWALGCILYEMANGRKPFGNDSNLHEYTRMAKSGSSKSLSPSDWIGAFDSTYRDEGLSWDFLTDLALQLLQVNHAERPSATSLLTKLYMEPNERNERQLILFLHQGPFIYFSGFADYPYTRRQNMLTMA